MHILKRIKEKFITGNSQTEFSKKELKQSLLKLEEKRRTFKIYHTITIVNFLSLFTMFVIVNRTIFDAQFLHLLFTSFFIVMQKIYIFKTKQLKNFNFMEEKERKKLIKNFTSYFTEKGKRKDNKEIKQILKRLEQGESHFQKTEKFYKFNQSVIIGFVYIQMFIIFLLVSVFLQGKLPNPAFFNPYISIFIYLSFYLVILYVYRNFHFKNIQRSKLLFELAFSKQLDENKQRIEELIKYIPESKFKEVVFNGEIISLLTEWFDIYSGVLFNDSESNKLAYGFRDYYIFLQKHEDFFILFNHLKIKIQILHDNKKNLENDNKNNLENIHYIGNLLDNMISYLKFNIEYEKNTIREKREKFKLFHSSLLIISTILSILAFFYSIP